MSIFHEEWVRHSLVESGFRSDLYLSPFRIQDKNAKFLQLDFVALSDDSSDLLMARLLSDEELVIEEVLFLSALKVARVVRELLKASIEVFLVGMDFDADQGYSRQANLSFTPTLDASRSHSLALQKNFLQSAMYMLDSTEMRVSHVGYQNFSSVSPEGAIRLLEGHRTDASPKKNSQSVLITAEVTTNHFGDRNRLETLIRRAKLAGADFVKFQKRNVETFYSSTQLRSPYTSPFGSSFGDYRLALELSREDFEFIDNLCRVVGIGWFVSVLDLPSFEFVMEMNPSLIKLPSTISEHTEYLEEVSKRYRGPLVISTGMTDEHYEEWVLKTFAGQEKLYLLHANSAYPTPEHDCNIAVIQRYKRLAEQNPFIVPGWSSHDHGWLASALAVAAGAGMIEKHVKLGENPWAHFDAVAVDVTGDDFSEFVHNVRRAEVIMGSGTKQVTSSEHHKYRRQ